MEGGTLLVGPAVTLGLAVIVAATAALAAARPFVGTLHTWGLTAVVAVAGLALLVRAFASILGDLWSPGYRSSGYMLRGPMPGAERFAGLSAVGAAVLAAAIVQAEFLAGAPQRIGAAPGQTFLPSPGARVSIRFPTAEFGSSTHGVRAVLVDAGGRRRELTVGQTLRSGPYVFRAEPWPIAYVRARSPAGKSVTVTQRLGAAFASPYLLFPFQDEGRPADAFEVPPLHREIRVAYYPGLPSAGIDIPLLLVQINEENGGTLYQGATVSGKPIKKAGIWLVFALSTYPLVLMTGAPAPVPLSAGLAMVAAALAGYFWTARHARGPAAG